MMAYCDRTGKQTNLEDHNDGALTCPECGELCSDLETTTQSHWLTETIASLADGWSLRSGVYEPAKDGALTSGEYVRLCRPDGSEYAYWDQEEWRTDPALVMGAIVNAAAGLRLEE